MAKKALGKGLGALIPDSRLKELEHETYFIPVEEISSFSRQPRKFFQQDKIKELAQSIIRHGIIQPLLVCKKDDGYELIAGERRLRAAKEAGLKEVPAIISNISADKRLEVSIIENIQRENLNPIEEAMAYNSMIDDLNLSQEEVAERVGRQRSTITNTLRLLKLPAEIKQYVVNEEISMGHARALLSLKTSSQQITACQYVIKKGSSVRDTEKYVQKLQQPKVSNKNLPENNAFMADLEDKLKRKFSTKVKINQNRQKKGRISIEFYSTEDLDRIINLMFGANDL